MPNNIRLGLYAAAVVLALMALAAAHFLIERPEVITVYNGPRLFWTAVIQLGLAVAGFVAVIATLGAFPPLFGGEQIRKLSKWLLGCAIWSVLFVLLSIVSVWFVVAVVVALLSVAAYEAIGDLFEHGRWRRLRS